jgi:hypothetical protein
MTTDEAIEYLKRVDEFICSMEKHMPGCCYHNSEPIEMSIEALKREQWIPVSERLPEERINPITLNYYEYPCTFKCGNVSEVRYFRFGMGHWWNGPGIMDKYITAWRPLPEQYKEK